MLCNISNRLCQTKFITRFLLQLADKQSSLDFNVGVCQYKNCGHKIVSAYSEMLWLVFAF